MREISDRALMSRWQACIYVQVNTGDGTMDRIVDVLVQALITLVVACTAGLLYMNWNWPTDNDRLDSPVTGQLISYKSIGRRGWTAHTSYEMLLDNMGETAHIRVYSGWLPDGSFQALGDLANRGAVLEVEIVDERISRITVLSVGDRTKRPHRIAGNYQVGERETPYTFYEARGREAALPVDSSLLMTIALSAFFLFTIVFGLYWVFYGIPLQTKATRRLKETLQNPEISRVHFVRDEAQVRFFATSASLQSFFLGTFFFSFFNINTDDILTLGAGIYFLILFFLCLQIYRFIASGRKNFISLLPSGLRTGKVGLPTSTLTSWSDIKAVSLHKFGKAGCLLRVDGPKGKQYLSPIGFHLHHDDIFEAVRSYHIRYGNNGEYPN